MIKLRNSLFGMLAILVTVGFYRLPNAPDTAPRQIETSTAVEIATPPAAPRTTEERIDKLLRDSIWTDDADARATLVGDTLKVQLHGEPAAWVDTIDVIRNAIHDFVPDTFKELRQVTTVEMHWTVDLVDVRGNEFREEGARSCVHPSQRREHQLGQRARRKPDVSGRRLRGPTPPS